MSLDPDNILRAAIDDLIDIFVEEEVQDIVNDRVQQYLFGKEEEEPNADEIDPELQSVNAPNLDIFGQLIGKKVTFDVPCPNCKRTLAAVRYAPHLEKCMGMGRNSSRIASRRLAAAAGIGIGNSSNTVFVAATDSQRAMNPTSSAAMSMTTSSGVMQTTGNNGDNPSEDEHSEDMDDDEDWTMEKKRRSKKSAEKTSSRR